MEISLKNQLIPLVCKIVFFFFCFFCMTNLSLSSLAQALKETSSIDTISEICKKFWQRVGSLGLQHDIFSMQT